MGPPRQRPARVAALLFAMIAILLAAGLEGHALPAGPGSAADVVHAADDHHEGPVCHGAGEHDDLGTKTRPDPDAGPLVCPVPVVEVVEAVASPGLLSWDAVQPVANPMTGRRHLVLAQISRT